MAQKPSKRVRFNLRTRNDQDDQATAASSSSATTSAPRQSPSNPSGSNESACDQQSSSTTTATATASASASASATASACASAISSIDQNQEEDEVEAEKIARVQEILNRGQTFPLAEKEFHFFLRDHVAKEIQKIATKYGCHLKYKGMKKSWKKYGRQDPNVFVRDQVGNPSNVRKVMAKMDEYLVSSGYRRAQTYFFEGESSSDEEDGDDQGAHESQSAENVEPPEQPQAQASRHSLGDREAFASIQNVTPVGESNSDTASSVSTEVASLTTMARPNESRRRTYGLGRGAGFRADQDQTMPFDETHPTIARGRGRFVSPPLVVSPAASLSPINDTNAIGRGRWFTQLPMNPPGISSMVQVLPCFDDLPEIPPVSVEELVEMSPVVVDVEEPPQLVMPPPPPPPSPPIRMAAAYHLRSPTEEEIHRSLHFPHNVVATSAPSAVVERPIEAAKHPSCSTNSRRTPTQATAPSEFWRVATSPTGAGGGQPTDRQDQWYAQSRASSMVGENGSDVDEIGSDTESELVENDSKGQSTTISGDSTPQIDSTPTTPRVAFDSSIAMPTVANQTAPIDRAADRPAASSSTDVSSTSPVVADRPCASGGVRQDRQEPPHWLPNQSAMNQAKHHPGAIHVTVSQLVARASAARAQAQAQATGSPSSTTYSPSTPFRPESSGRMDLVDPSTTAAAAIGSNRPIPSSSTMLRNPFARDTTRESLGSVDQGYASSGRSPFETRGPAQSINRGLASTRRDQGVEERFPPYLQLSDDEQEDEHEDERVVPLVSGLIDSPLEPHPIAPLQPTVVMIQPQPTAAPQLFSSQETERFTEASDADRNLINFSVPPTVAALDELGDDLQTTADVPESLDTIAMTDLSPAQIGLIANMLKTTINDQMDPAHSDRFEAAASRLDVVEQTYGRVETALNRCAEQVGRLDDELNDRHDRLQAPASSVEKFDCTVCMSHEIETVFDCGHAFCRRCADRQRTNTGECMLCRREITDAHNMFL